MKRTLSSDWTPFHKTILPIFWLAFWSVGIFLMFLPGSGVPMGVRFAFLAMLFFGAAMFYWFGIRLKVVVVDENYLYVSNYGKEITIPLGDIYAVTENKWVNNRLVTIHLNTASEFGDKIVFMPKIKMFLLFGDHPIVTELRELIAKHRRATRSGD